MELGTCTGEFGGCIGLGASGGGFGGGFGGCTGFDTCGGGFCG